MTNNFWSLKLVVNVRKRDERWFECVLVYALEMGTYTQHDDL